MLSVSSRIWTRVTVSISYDDNYYTTVTSDPKVNVIVWLEFEFVYFETAVQDNRDSPHNHKWHTLSKTDDNWNDWFGLVWFVWFYGISTFVGYLTPNPFLCK